MKRHYYIFNESALVRHDNTIYVETEEGKRPVPIEDVSGIYLMGEVRLNTRLLNFLTQHEVLLHVFNYYGYYAGSYIPRDAQVSGETLLRQAERVLEIEGRLEIAREMIRGSIDNCLRTLKYYQERDVELADILSELDLCRQDVNDQPDIEKLMLCEGRGRAAYFGAYDRILKWDSPFEYRSRRPPHNPVNALLSFGNSLLYTVCIAELYHTGLHPALSFVHAPGERRFSLALDLADIFKPILVDRTIFTLVNRRQITETHFHKEANGVFLNEEGRKTFIREWEDKLATTIKHREIEKEVSYRRLIRLEAYKLQKHVLNVKPYRAFRAWW